MTDVFEIKQHDLEPPLVSDLIGSAGDLTTPGITWKVVAAYMNLAPAWTDTSPTVTVLSPTSATVTHNWVSGQTDVAGTQLVEIQATWPGGRPQTFPEGDYKRVRVVADLG